MQIFEKVDFQRKTFFEVALENFSDVIWRCSRYLKVSPNIVLRVREKITSIQHVHKNIFQKNQNLGSKNKPSLHTTVVFHQAGSSQNEQSLLFRAFETSDLWKDRFFVKRGPWLVFHQARSSQNEQTFLFTAFEALERWKDSAFLNKKNWFFFCF